MGRRSFCAARSSPDCTSRIATPSCPPYSAMVRVSADTASLRAGTALPSGLVRCSLQVHRRRGRRGSSRRSARYGRRGRYRRRCRGDGGPRRGGTARRSCTAGHGCARIAAPQGGCDNYPRPGPGQGSLCATSAKGVQRMGRAENDFLLPSPSHSREVFEDVPHRTYDPGDFGGPGARVSSGPAHWPRLPPRRPAGRLRSSPISRRRRRAGRSWQLDSGRPRCSTAPRSARPTSGPTSPGIDETAHPRGRTVARDRQRRLPGRRRIAARALYRARRS